MTMKIFILSMALTMAGIVSVMAQHGVGGHKHTSPHGGKVKTAGNYHLELLQKNSALTVYLLDAGEKPMPVAGATATALLQTSDGQVTTVKLPLTNRQQFVTTLDKTKSFKKAIINVALKGQSVSASFDLAPAGAGDGRTAPRH
jgi:hypothetical protein